MTMHPDAARLMAAVARRPGANAAGDESPRWQPAHTIIHPASKEAQEQRMTQSQTQRTIADGQEAARRHNLAPASSDPIAYGEGPATQRTAAGQAGARHHNLDPVSPTWAETAERAYAIYADNGCKDGEAEQNWREAERQLRERR